MTESYQQNIQRKWLLLAIFALAIAGLYSLPPVVLRGPFFKDLLPIETIFASSLVIHVNLSVLVWMLAIGGFLWSNGLNKKYYMFYNWAFWLAIFGAAFMSVSPLFPDPMPLKNNYVPVIRNLPFFLGLALFACAVLMQVVLHLMQFKNLKKDNISFGVYSSAVITIIAFVCFVIASHLVSSPADMGHYDFYENLFWGGGHVLQLTYTTLIMIVWLLLANAANVKTILNDKWLKILFFANLILAIPAPLFYLVSNSVEESSWLFTKQMREAGGIVPTVIGLNLLIVFFKNKTESKTLKSSLLLSILLFGYGGVLGFLISGSNAIIPAHYHGSIVGITIGFMGFVYYNMPKFGYIRFSSKLSLAQIWLYAIGQLMHVSGLALMGGYGALRKAPGTSQEIDTLLGKLMFFSGGAIAIIGGFMFVIICILAVLRKR